MPVALVALASRTDDAYVESSCTDDVCVLSIRADEAAISNVAACREAAISRVAACWAGAGCRWAGTMVGKGYGAGHDVVRMWSKNQAAVWSGVAGSRSMSPVSVSFRAVRFSSRTEDAFVWSSRTENAAVGEKRCLAVVADSRTDDAVVVASRTILASGLDRTAAAFVLSRSTDDAGLLSDAAVGDASRMDDWDAMWENRS